MSIHPTAIVSPDATLGTNVSVGAFTIIGPRAVIGANTRIASHCELAIEKGILPEGDLVVGANSVIRSGTVMYQNSRFGEWLVTGHKVTLREGIDAGANVMIGTLSDLMGHCEIGEFTRIYNNVHVSQFTKIGRFVWLFPYTIFTNDPHPPSDQIAGSTVEDYAVIATKTTILPGLRIGKGALVGAMTLVRHDVEPDTIYVGVPGQPRGRTDKIKFKDSGKPVYPWRRHFHRNYPDDIVREWKAEFPEG